MPRKRQYTSQAERQRAYRQRRKLRNAARDDIQPAFNFGRVILSLFDHSGVWSQPYVDAGYDVRRYDLKHGDDVRLLEYDAIPKPVHGILAAPPCTEFAVSGARWWEEKGEQALLDALALVDATLRIIHLTQPQWWVIENPVGRLSHYLGQPAMYFDPCQYGDPYTKKTGLWGVFNTKLRLEEVEPVEGSKMHRLPPSEKRAELRSVTPEGFARAFYLANP